MVLEAARRTIGMIIPGMLLCLVGYIFLAPYLRGVWQMRGLSWDFLINSIYYSPLGIYGAVTGMSATFIAMFVIFGALLSVTGAGKTFIDLALRLDRADSRAGPPRQPSSRAPCSAASREARSPT